MTRIGTTYETVFAAGFLIMAASSLAAAKLVQRLGRQPASIDKIVQSHFVGVIAGVAMYRAAVLGSPLLSTAAMTILGLILMQTALLLSDLAFTGPRRRQALHAAGPAPPPHVAAPGRQAMVWMLGLAAAFGLARLTAHAEESRAAMAANQPGQLDESLLGSSIGPFFRALKTHFPDEYRRIMAEFASDQANLGGESADAIARRTAWLERQINAFLLARHADIVRAPDEALVEIARRQEAYVREAEQLPALCAGFLTGRFDRSDPRLRQQASSGIARAGFALQAAMVAAARAGIDRPVLRDRARLEGPALAALGERLRGTPPETARLMNDPEALARATPVQQCAAAKAYHGALVALPPALTAYFIAISGLY